MKEELDAFERAQRHRQDETSAAAAATRPPTERPAFLWSDDADDSRCLAKISAVQTTYGREAAETGRWSAWHSLARSVGRSISRSGARLMPRAAGEGGAASGEPRWRTGGPGGRQADAADTTKWLSSRLHFVLIVFVAVNFQPTLRPSAHHTSLSLSSPRRRRAAAAAAAGNDDFSPLTPPHWTAEHSCHQVLYIGRATPHERRKFSTDFVCFVFAVKSVLVTRFDMTCTDFDDASSRSVSAAERASKTETKRQFDLD